MDDHVIPENEIHEILKEWPLAISLYGNVRAFYAPSFQVIREIDAQSSQAEVCCRFSPNNDPAFEMAEVRLGMRSPRIPEALTHELLHLNLHVQGFPVKVGVFGNPTWAPFRDFYGSVITEILNSLDHETFKSEFIAIGMDMAHFVAGRAELIPATWRHLLRALPPYIIFPVWGLTYLGELLDDQSGPATGRPEQMLQFGLEVISSADTAAKFVREWLARGDFKVPDQRRDAMDELLTFLHTPPLRYMSLVKDGKNDLDLAPL